MQRDTVIQSQRLILPQRLELSAAAEMTLEDNLDIFQKNGFEFEIEEDASRGGGRVKLVAVPMSKNWNFGPSDVEEMLFMMAELNPGTWKILQSDILLSIFLIKQHEERERVREYV